MSIDTKVSAHWGKEGLWEAILTMIDAAGLDTNNLTPDQLAPLDHLHGRGVDATRELLELINPGPEMHLLDIGSGVGGPARLAAKVYGSCVTGIDLTQEFCDVATMLTERTNLTDKVTIHQASALDLPFKDESFDAAYSQNVSMNIIDKETFYSEAFRILRTDSLFICAEYAEGPGGPPVFPVPWALYQEDSHLMRPNEIRQIIEGVGFEIIDFQDQSEIMIEFSKCAREKIASEGLPLMSSRVLLGDDGALRLKNSARSIEEKRTIPIQVTCRRS
jgi:SAM-dependent methyltransferase